MPHALAPLRRHGLLFSLCLMALISLASDAMAAGFFLPGHGVKPLGRAGAFVASGGQDLNSLWYNPANLAGMESFRLTVDLSLIDLKMTHTRAPRVTDNGETITYESVENMAPPKADPQLLMGGPLGVKGLSWGFGIYAPYLSGHQFPEDGPQRYVLVDNDASLLLYLHAAVAWEYKDWVRIGAGFQNVPANFVLVNVTSAYTGLYGEAEDPDLDILTRITLRNLFNPSGNFGAWVRVTPNVEAAVSFQLPVRIRDRNAKIETRLPSNAFFEDAKLEGDSIDGEMRFPFMARLGVRLKLERFDHELALVYENWSSFREIQADPNDVRVTGVPGVGSIRVAPLSIPMNYQDTFSIRNGAEVAIKPHIALRLGHVYEGSAIPDEYYSVFLADSKKHVFTLGGSYGGESWSVDTAVAYYLLADRSISTSRVRQINPTDSEGENTTIVANGEYAQRYFIFGLGLNKSF